MTQIPDPYPAYSRAERIADGTVHAAGVIFAVTGAIMLTVLATTGHDAGGNTANPALHGGLIAAIAVYGAALIATFVASACYHMTPWEAARPALRRLDHAAIYLKIAGTYTPLVVLIGTGFGYVVLGLVWALAIGGAAVKIFFWQSPGRLGTALYLLMGWLSVALIWPMAATLPTAGTGLVIAGGLTYSLGVIFFVWEGLKFSNAIWHVMVLAASACFFAAIALGVISAQAPHL